MEIFLLEFLHESNNILNYKQNKENFLLLIIVSMRIRKEAERIKMRL